MDLSFNVAVPLPSLCCLLKISMFRLHLHLLNQNFWIWVQVQVIVVGTTDGGGI